MAAPRNAVSIMGNLPEGEVWSINPNFAEQGGGLVQTYEGLLTWATNIGQLNGTRVLPDSLRSQVSEAADVSRIRTAYMDSSGKTAAVAEYTLPTTQAGSGAATKPFQSAVVVSLMTGRPGRSYRGRLYLPALATAINSSTLRITKTNRETIAGGMREFLTGIQLAAPIGTEPLLCVYSQKLEIASGIVTSLEVGDILDTQRRRRDAVIEQRTSIPYPEE